MLRRLLTVVQPNTASFRFDDKFSVRVWYEPDGKPLVVLCDVTDARGLARRSQAHCSDNARVYRPFPTAHGRMPHRVVGRDELIATLNQKVRDESFPGRSRVKRFDEWARRV